jgi:hypothetical protein
MSVSNTRRITGGIIFIGKNESVPLTVDFANWLSGPLTSPTVSLFDVTTGQPGTDVSGTKLSGSASVSGTVVTTPLITGLTDGATYLLRVKVTKGTGIYEAWDFIQGEL